MQILRKETRGTKIFQPKICALIFNLVYSFHLPVCPACPPLPVVLWPRASPAVQVLRESPAARAIPIRPPGRAARTRHARPANQASPWGPAGPASRLSFLRPSPGPPPTGRFRPAGPVVRGVPGLPACPPDRGVQAVPCCRVALLVPGKKFPYLRIYGHSL
jgi:hypothetical protein